MKTIKNVEYVLKEINAPRFHYLKGDAFYEQIEKTYKLTAIARFPATEEYPSVYDRNKEGIKNPHVNVADSLHAIWNSVHLISREVKRKSTFAVKVLDERLYGIIPANVDLEISVLVKDIRNINNKIFSEYKGIIFLDGKKLFERSGIGTSEER
ncbi:MAG: hypothetical protein ABIE36_02825 [Candidatus Diapherotrites archaeon]